MRPRRRPGRARTTRWPGRCRARRPCSATSTTRASSTAASPRASSARAAAGSSRPRTATGERRRLRGGRRRRLAPAAAVPDLARARPHPGLRHRLGRRGRALVPGLSRRPAAARRRLPLDRALQELGGALRRVPRHRLQPQLPPETRTYAPDDGRDRRRLRGLPRAGRRPRRRPGGGRRCRPASAPRRAGRDRAVRRPATPGARRFGDGNPLPGTPFHDSFNLALLRPGLYEPDGADPRGGLRVRLVPAVEDVRPRRALLELPRAALDRAPGRGQRGLHPVPLAGRQPGASRRCASPPTTTRRTTSTRPAAPARNAAPAT